MLKFFIVLLIIVLLGCSEKTSDSNIENRENIVGFYFGSFVNDVNISSSIYALISEDGDMRVIFSSLSGQAAGQLTKTDNLYVGSLALYQNSYENIFDAKSSDIQVEVEVTDGDINGNWSDSSSSGRIILIKISDSNQRTDLVQLTANWVLNISNSSGGLFTLAISIDSQKNVTGSDTAGCTYLGNIIDLNKAGGVIPFNLGLSSCGNKNGEYHGLMFLTPADTLIMLASNNAYSFTVELNK